jgi:ABC transporter substrate binding protein
MRLQLHVVDVREPTELNAAFNMIARERSDALILAADPLLFSQGERIVELAARYRLPAVYEHRSFPEVGGLLSYGPLSQERFKRMAVYVDRILRGAQPGDLPVEQPTKFELVINMKTAKALGLTIPPSLMLRADQVIEWRVVHHNVMGSRSLVILIVVLLSSAGPTSGGLPGYFEWVLWKEVKTQNNRPRMGCRAVRQAVRVRTGTRSAGKCDHQAHGSSQCLEHNGAGCCDGDRLVKGLHDSPVLRP